MYLSCKKIFHFYLQNGVFVGPVLSVPLMLLAVYGLGTGSKYIPTIVRLFMYMSYLRYGLEGLVSAIYGNNRAPMRCPEQEMYCQLREPRALLKEVGMEDVDYWVDIAALAATLLIFKIICYVLLRKRLSSTQKFGALYYISRLVKSHFNFTGQLWLDIICYDTVSIDIHFEIISIF